MTSLDCIIQTGLELLTIFKIFHKRQQTQTTINSKTNNNNNNNNNATMTPYSTTSANATNNETTILKQGLVSSSKSQPNETSQVAILLPHRSDGKTYSGTLTYSATSPVEIGLLHGISIDNNTLASIKSIYGDSAPHWIDYASSKHHLNKTDYTNNSGH